MLNAASQSGKPKATMKFLSFWNPGAFSCISKLTTHLGKDVQLCTALQLRRARSRRCPHSPEARVVQGNTVIPLTAAAVVQS